METKGENGATETPLLILSQGEPVVAHSIYDMSENLFRKLNIPTFTGKKLLGSFYGWLVLVEPLHYNDGDGDCCLFNPTTNDVIELPKLNDSINYDQCVLTGPPTEQDCYILFNGLEQAFCRIGDKEYVIRTLKQQEEEEQENGRVGFDNLIAIGSFQGQTYGFMDPDKFVAINFVGNTMEFSRIPMVEPWVIPHDSDESGVYDVWLFSGEPLMVQKIYDDCGVVLDFLVFQIDRFDTDQIKCTEVKNIGNRTIFVSDDGVGYCRPSIGTKANSIYYSNGDDMIIYIFDLEDRSTSMLPSSDDAAANKSIMTACWIENQQLF
ncbi:hypothetical protein ABFX02_04G081300 [Erythranthe guttata]